jgi:mannosylglycerate hydrolase
LKKRKPQQKDEKGITAQNGVFENDFYRLRVLPDGSLALFDKETGVTLKDLLVFEDCGDAGDTYNYSPVKEDLRVLSKGGEAQVTVLDQGPVMTSVLIELTLEVPKKLVDNDTQRSEDRVQIPIKTTLHLYTGLKRIDCVTQIENQALDHRLRVLFNAGITSPYSSAETQFGTIRRMNTIPTENWKKEGWKEKPLPIYSQQRFVDLNDDKTGLAILNRGLPEYEIYDDSTIAVTLVRGVGMMGKGDLLIRPGRPSGMPVTTPDAQCSGRRVLEYAILPHSGDVDQGRVPYHAAQYAALALVVQNRICDEKLISKEKAVGLFLDIKGFTYLIQAQLKPIGNASSPLVTVNKDEILISAVKKAEVGQALVLRLYNASASAVDDVQIQFDRKIENAVLTNFAEQEIEGLVVDDESAIRFAALPGYKAKTIKVTFAD